MKIFKLNCRGFIFQHLEIIHVLSGYTNFGVVGDSCQSLVTKQQDTGSSVPRGCGEARNGRAQVGGTDRGSKTRAQPSLRLCAGRVLLEEMAG